MKRNKKYMLVVASFIALSALSSSSSSREQFAGQFDNVDPATRSWFKGVKSPNGVPCCDISDGHETDFKVDGVGHYFVPIKGEWTLVPPEAVITSQGNPNEMAVVWYVQQPAGVFIRCFVPVGGV